ncbi:hypothetical protein [Streptomyces sp. ISL-86]|uniref:hypothetical protein n=1 Tax=Streptomyces sp. ISL-86 TaxID=2819187 RepID=UPI001BE7E567|nr:hypothetical protein [Streptomyces sp. ISL-86]MBT2455568.1 hypothetical protein [Streptomyces sp. ISL-86]
MRTREELLAAVHGRLNRVLADGNRSAVLEAAALVEAGDLASYAADGSAVDLEVAHALGWLYFWRAPLFPRRKPGRRAGPPFVSSRGAS